MWAEIVYCLILALPLGVGAGLVTAMWVDADRRR